MATTPDISRADQRGFTLAELLVAIAIIGLIMAGILTLLMTGNQSYLTGSNQAEAQAAARAAMERMTADIREAGYDPQSRACTAPGVPGGCFDALTATSATGFTIQSDWNGAGPAAPASPIEPNLQVPVPYCIGLPCPPTPLTNVNRGEQVTYSIVGGNLRRQESAVDVQPLILVTSVQQAATGTNCQGVQIANPPVFQYCDGSGNPAPTTDQIKMVAVNLQVGVQNQPPAIWQAGRVFVTVSDRIRLRNRL